MCARARTHVHIRLHLHRYTQNQGNLQFCLAYDQMGKLGVEICDTCHFWIEGGCVSLKIQHTEIWLHYGFNNRLFLPKFALTITQSISANIQVHTHTHWGTHTHTHTHTHTEAHTHTYIYTYIYIYIYIYIYLKLSVILLRWFAVNMKRWGLWNFRMTSESKILPQTFREIYFYKGH